MPYVRRVHTLSVSCRCWLAAPCRVAGCRRCLTSAARATHDFANTAPPCLASRTVVMLHRCALYRHNAHVTLVYCSIYWTTYCFSRVCRPVHLRHFVTVNKHVTLQPFGTTCSDSVSSSSKPLGYHSVQFHDIHHLWELYQFALSWFLFRTGIIQRGSRVFCNLQ